MCNEHRSSKTCICCGKTLEHPVSKNTGKPCRGVVFCKGGGPDGDGKPHFNMMNRDTSAAFKMWFLFLGRLLSCNLGEFARPVNDYTKELHLREHSDQAKNNPKTLQSLFQWKKVPVRGKVSYGVVEQVVKGRSIKVKIAVQRPPSRRHMVWRPISLV
jgi:hypothetical protein